MNNAPLEVSQWGPTPVARSHTVKTGPINLTLEIALFQEQKKKESWKNGIKKLNEVVPALLTQWINVNIIMSSFCHVLELSPDTTAACQKVLLVWV